MGWVGGLRSDFESPLNFLLLNATLRARYRMVSDYNFVKILTLGSAIL